MSCGPPYCLGPEGTGCVPVQANGRPCKSCKCCPPKCYDRLDFQITCGTPSGRLLNPPPGYACCGTQYVSCCGTPGPCPNCNCPGSGPYIPPSNYLDCGELPFFNNNYLKYRKIRKDKIPSKNYHDFLGFSSDDYLNNDYYFPLKEEVQALEEVPGPDPIETTCGGAATPCQNLVCSLTSSGCCFSCPPISNTVCLPQLSCGLTAGDPRELNVGACFVIIGDGTVNLTVPSPPCGTICTYINGIEGTSASLKNCDLFCFEIQGFFKNFECCTCCYRTGFDYLTVHNWGAAAFRQYNKNIMQKNLAEKMKKIKF